MYINNIHLDLFWNVKITSIKHKNGYFDLISDIIYNKNLMAIDMFIGKYTGCIETKFFF